MGNIDIEKTEPAVKQYLAYLAKYPDGSEIQYRTSFEMLFNSIKLPSKKITIIQEYLYGGIGVEGTPDFSVFEDYDANLKSLVGFIECKKPSYRLDKLIDSKQIKNYSKTCENIILTNYHRFILLQKGKIEHDIELSNNPATIQNFLNLLQDFYGYTYPYIKTKNTLVSSLAAQSFYYSVALREFINNKENELENFYTKFNGLFTQYESSINYHYELADFCDIYAQSFVYGLLLARLDKGEQLDEQKLNYLENIPDDYKLLKEFLSQAYQNWDLPTEIKIAITNIGKNINRIDTAAITKEFQKTNNGKQNIAVYLYEDFLAQYDKFRGTENRKEGGVYYTPSEAADFISRSVNYLLKNHFNLPQGYNSENVKILDFACGTGTFLHSVFEQMIPNKTELLQKGTIKNKITKDIYGFELLFTPYIIAHTILTRFLKEKGIVLNADKKERLGIYLTNTLDISQHSISELLPELKKEYEKARDIKDRENVLAIVGNPPYFNGKSHAKKGVIDAELQKYKEGLNEKKINLDDDYIKFIRFAEWKITKSKQGIVGIVVNNSWLNGIVHRQMRKHLYNTFDEIYVMNLHGDTDRKESDKNIFEIKRGVCIVFFVKKTTPTKQKRVFYFSTLENNFISRAEKLSFLENVDFRKINWVKVKPAETGNYWFSKKDFSEEKIYSKFWKLTEIFKEFSSTNKTERDGITIHYNRTDLKKVIDDFINLYPNELFAKYNTKDSRDWKVSKAKQDLIANKGVDLFVEYVYRPFDTRITYFTGQSRGFIGTPSKIIAKHFLNKVNFGLCFKRELNKNYFNTIFVVDKMVDISVLEHSHGSTYIAPLFFYNGLEHPEMLKLDFEGDGEKYANFSQNFIKNYLEQIDFQPTPEEILAYIYAVLHSKIYREKYVEFLKTDFPAVPFTTDKEIFDKYAELGQKLIDLHLFKNLPKDNEIRFDGEIDDSVTIEKTVQNNNKLFLHTDNNKTITISGVSKEIYNFEIGSYKPIEKWLKYRIKDKVALNCFDLQHLKNMIIAIKNTVSVMSEIEGLGEKYLDGGE